MYCCMCYHSCCSCHPAECRNQAHANNASRQKFRTPALTSCCSLSSLLTALVGGSHTSFHQLYNDKD